MAAIRRDPLLEILSELAEIDDEELRNRTADVWVDGADIGGYGVEELLEFPAAMRLASFDLSLIEHTGR